ncbi:hypothetical protein PghCCS26_31290 [Paenibacillus glycanilyticus]|uniref:YcxB-like C-terminal domain-containing protein n=1 Tax=Paenibacillus glycanilyticus TaxID=126569 RepID=A0ABQ6NLN1_9BACL|nr:YcxB family protein [Paenibacillus glycanilyticus]GMK46001.1 hypothetical protein PghCCS26_31290 [Paenibacillus glycanilyticus]
METIRFHYGQHAARAMKSLYFQTLRIRLTWVFEILLVITCFSLAVVTNSRLLAVIAAAVVVVALLNFVTHCIVHPRRIVKDRKLNGEFEYSFNSDHLKLTVTDGTSNVNWSHFAKVWENERYYFLFHNKRQYWIIPKESFRNSEQEQVFRRIVQSHHPITTGVIR